MKYIDALTYQPSELPFGTSGLRGLVTDMTDLECYINAAGFLKFLAEHDNLKPGDTVCIAGDLRNSTPRIMQAVAAAIAAGGYTCVQCGKIPTPALAFYALQRGAPCIMVSGSHIPDDRNGIKFYKRTGEVLKADEAGIQDAVREIRNQLYAVDAETSLFDNYGSKRQLPALGPIDIEAEAAYKRRYLDVFPSDGLAGKEVVVYQQSAVARDLLVEVLQALGAEVVPIERSDVFVPIDTDKITDDEKARFRRFATEHPRAFAIVSADGDSDRPIVVDERGEFHWGDLLGCIVADFLGTRSAVTVVSANDAVDMFCTEHSMTLTKTKIGSPYVISAMTSVPAYARPAAAWELNGGFLLGDEAKLNSKTLKSLQTRDAMLPILACLMSAERQKLRISELFARLPQRFAAADLIDGVPEDQIAAFRAISSDQARMQVVMAKLFAGSGLGDITDINVTDGVRVRFASSDVLHFRPSGNAPQFRVYTNASSQTRADELVRLSLMPGGFIEQLLKVVK